MGKHSAFRGVLKVRKKACRKQVKRRLGVICAVTPDTISTAAKELILRRCRTCGGCWMSRL